MKIFNCDCIEGAKKYLETASVDLMIHDPPFGINEVTFDKHYARNKELILDGYIEAPKDYFNFTVDWLVEAKRIMKPDASMYIISGYTHLLDILNAIEQVELYLINHIIWKFNFGLSAKTKYVSSHYHILYLKKNKQAVPIFNTNCRFGWQEKDERNGSLLYQDLEDVWYIKKEYQPGEIKNKNKLPDALIEKIILYSSDVGSVVCDFFLGNFTTAIVSKKLGRIPCGFEVNPKSFNYHMEKLNQIESGCDLTKLKTVENIVPVNQGKPITDDERTIIIKEFQDLIKTPMTKKAAMSLLCEKYGRGRFSIVNILKGKV